MDSLTVVDFIDSRRDQHQDDLIRLLKIPSVSTDSSRRDQMQRCAEEVRRQLQEAGLERTEVFSTEGHPVVVGEWTGAPAAPTLLFYGHYDVQPEDPLEKWTTPPFEPTLRDGKIWARGATDDKGQFLTHVKAVHALMETEGRLPVNVKFVIEGEEEIGSPHLRPFLEAQRERLAADVLVISDSAMFGPGQPSLLYGLRGLAYLQVDLEGASSDLHSGVFGGAVPNPGYELCRIVAALKDDQGRCTVPGFYDQVVELSSEERQGFASLPFNPEEFRRTVGCPGLSGEEGYSVLEQRWARPTLEVNGLLCGFTGEGAKTVLPGHAMAKLSCRLVPNQDPGVVAEALERYIQKLCPPHVHCRVTYLHGAHPWITPPHHPALRIAARAVEKVFGKKPVTVREGGSIPVVVDFEKVLGLPGVLLGFGLNDENLHAPNEHLDLGNYHLGIRTSVELMREMATYRP